MTSRWSGWATHVYGTGEDGVRLIAVPRAGGKLRVSQR